MWNKQSSLSRLLFCSYQNHFPCTQTPTRRGQMCLKGKIMPYMAYSLSLRYRNIKFRILLGMSLNRHDGFSFVTSFFRVTKSCRGKDGFSRERYADKPKRFGHPIFFLATSPFSTFFRPPLTAPGWMFYCISLWCFLCILWPSVSSLLLSVEG